jgi:hypothetical protein
MTATNCHIRAALLVGARKGFALAGNRFTSPIGVEDRLFGIML